MIFSRQIVWQNAEQVGGATPPFSDTAPMSAATATCPCCDITLDRPKLVAYGSDSQTISNQIAATGLQYTTKDPVVEGLVGADAPTMLFAEDATFSDSRSLPNSYANPQDQIADRVMFPQEFRILDRSRAARVERLRDWVSKALAAAKNDDTGFAGRYFDHMFGPLSAPRALSEVKFHEDEDLNRIAKYHVMVGDFCDLVLNAPGDRQSNNFRLHQALEAADWDINRIRSIDDLGVPAFKDYGWIDQVFLGNDMGNGLTLTVHGLQHASAVVKEYCYDSDARKYSLKLTCFLYDAFGIDTDDLVEFGQPKHAFVDLSENDGAFDDVKEFVRLHRPLASAMNAWWLLQHSYGFAPLITRIVMEKEYEVYVG